MLKIACKFGHGKWDKNRLFKALFILTSFVEVYLVKRANYLKDNLFVHWH